MRINAGVPRGKKRVNNGILSTLGGGACYGYCTTKTPSGKAFIPMNIVSHDNALTRRQRSLPAHIAWLYRPSHALDWSAVAWTMGRMESLLHWLVQCLLEFHYWGKCR
ncbi:hypothetical protein C7212DRAFT_314139 [Tuber magnatum]|uniref:Uncharacterized protein n=1 Tax=Tuber magnatum TaxID=42249 RepID=A0A317SSM3_9PEZI|nr:hypothetical protein C7212DRAFT_314139 [Tuber magnatum]